MTIFYELTTDAFEDSFNRVLEGDHARRYSSASSAARRPLRGLEIKDDTYASISLIDAAGTPIPILNSSTRNEDGKAPSTTNFIIQSVTEARMEKHQIVETFGESYLFLFGERPRFLDVQAVLVDSFDFNWYGEWWENYNRYLRGTRSVELNARTYLFYEDNVVEGYMLQAQSAKTSDTPLMAQLSFRLYLTSYSNVTMITTSTRYPIRHGAVLPNIKLRSLPGQEKTSLTDTLKGITGDVINGGGTLGGQLRVASDTLSSAGVSPTNNVLLNASTGVNEVTNYTAGVAGTAGQVKGVIDDATNLISGKKKNPLTNFFRSVPLRGNIADNLDEFTGGYPFVDEAALEGKKGANILGKIAEVQSLAKKTITTVKSVGALLDDTPKMLRRLGIMDSPDNAPGNIRGSTTKKVAEGNAASFAAASAATQGGSGSATSTVGYRSRQTNGVTFSSGITTTSNGGRISSAQPVEDENAAAIILAATEKKQSSNANKNAFGMAASAGTLKV